MDKKNIGTLARFMGVSIHTIKYYDKIGLLHSERDENSNYRQFDLSICTDLSECIKYRSMGFSLKELDVLLKSVGNEEHRAMLRERIQLLDEELKRTQTIRDHLLSYERDCIRAEEDLDEWYIEAWNGIAYCRMQTAQLTFTKECLASDSVNMMDFAPQTTNVVVLKKNYLNGGEQEFSWGQSVLRAEPDEVFEQETHICRFSPRKVFVAFRRYTGTYVADGTMAEDIRQLFRKYGEEFPGDAYCFRVKITYDEAGNRWHYFKIVIPLK